MCCWETIVRNLKTVSIPGWLNSQIQKPEWIYWVKRNPHISEMCSSNPHCSRVNCIYISYDSGRPIGIEQEGNQILFYLLIDGH